MNVVHALTSELPGYRPYSLLLPFSGGSLHGVRIVQVVPAITVEVGTTGEVSAFGSWAVTGAGPEPRIVFAWTKLAVFVQVGEFVLVLQPSRFGPLRGLQYLLPSVLLPRNLGLGAEDTRSLLAAEDVFGHEGTDVEPHSVVDVRLPADGLFVDGLPPDEDVIGGLTFENGFEAPLELTRRRQAVLRALFMTLCAISLADNPVAEIAVGEGFQELAALAVSCGQLVVVDQRVKAVAASAVPDVPHERAMVEQLAVLVEEAVAEPLIEAVAVYIGEDGSEDGITPFVAVRRRKQAQQPIPGRRFASYRWDADDAVLVHPFE